jgi:hypothetical protein
MKHTGVRLTLVVLEAFVALTSIVCGVGLAVGVIQFSTLVAARHAF